MSQVSFFITFKSHRLHKLGQALLSNRFGLPPSHPIRSYLLTLALPCLLVSGCSGDPSDPSPEPTSSLTPAPSPSPSPSPSPTPLTDADGDGFAASTDCDDLDPSSAPGYLESCDGRDNNCDGSIDEDVKSVFLRDRDGDGFGVESSNLLACTAPAGYVSEGGDCDDRHPARYPGASIVCDGHDNNCDGRLEITTRYYLDRDGDGFGGSETVEDCDFPFQGTDVSGDCADNDSSIYPAAPDPAGDSIDQDCGGTPEQEPCVGYPGCSTLISEALTLAKSGTRIAVSPGVYRESNLSFAGKALTLYAPAGPAATLIDGQEAQAPLFLFNQKETTSAVLEGFTLQNSLAGALSVTDASPTFRRLILQNNRSATGGAGGRFLRSSAVFDQVLIQDNHSDAEFEGGGGLYLEQSPLTLTRVKLLRNHASLGNGGGIYALSSAPKLSDCLFGENEAHLQGGGAYIEGSGGSWSRIELNSNRATWGAGIAVVGASPSVLQSVFLDNRADEAGAALYLSRSSSAPVIQNTIFAWNSGGQISVASQSDLPAPTFQSVLLYSFNGNDHNFKNFPGEGTLTVNPGFMRVTLDGLANDALHGRPGAALLNSGKSGTLDDDGSRADLGIYGGPGAPRDWLADADADGLPDGWERENGLSPSTQEQLLDTDLDGATTQEELAAAIDPRHPDSDLDGVSDGQELAASSDPDDFYQRPGEEAPAPASVPGDFDSLAEALAAVRSSGYIRLGEGTFTGGQAVVQHQLLLEGQGPELTILSGAGETRVLRIQDATVKLARLGLREGLASSGAGLWSRDALLELDELHFEQHRAEGDSASGGCLQVRAGELIAQQLVLESCEAVGSSARGGGIWLDQLTGTLKEVRISQAHASDPEGLSTQGGGLGLDGVSLNLFQLQLDHNSAQGQGGGLYAQRSTLMLQQSLLQDNTLTGSMVQGAGLYARDSELHLAHVWVEGSVALSSTSATGGGAYFKEVTGTLEQVVWLDNAATSGGGFFAVNTSFELDGGVCAGNQAEYGGGIFVTGNTNVLHFKNVIVAENEAEGFYDAGPILASLSAEGTVLAAGFGGSRSNGSSLESMTLANTPDFVWPPGGDAGADLHLNLYSDVLDQGVGLDLDGSQADPGAYGASSGCAWDLDGDGLPAACWPGAFDDVPAGIQPDDFDCDDFDPLNLDC